MCGCRVGNECVSNFLIGLNNMPNNFKKKIKILWPLAAGGHDMMMMPLISKTIFGKAQYSM